LLATRHFRQKSQLDSDLKQKSKALNDANAQLESARDSEEDLREKLHVGNADLLLRSQEIDALKVIYVVGRVRRMCCPLASIRRLFLTIYSASKEAVIFPKKKIFQKPDLFIRNNSLPAPTRQINVGAKFEPSSSEL